MNCASDRDEGAYGLECRNLLPAVRVEVLLHVVDGHAAVEVAHECIRVLRHALIGAVARPEVHDGRPVVREVLAEGARRAGGPLRYVRVRIHGRIEAVATNDLVHMGRGRPAGLDNGVESLDAQRGAPKAKVRMGRRSKRKRKGSGEKHHLVNAVQSGLQRPEIGDGFEKDGLTAPLTEVHIARYKLSSPIMAAVL